MLCTIVSLYTQVPSYQGVVNPESDRPNKQSEIIKYLPVKVDVIIVILFNLIVGITIKRCSLNTLTPSNQSFPQMCTQPINHQRDSFVAVNNPTTT